MRLYYFLVFFLLITVIQHPSHSQQRYNYEERGNRMEGIKPIDVSVYDLELLSFVSYIEPTELNLDVDLRIRFFADEDTNIFISAKELMPQKSYLMHPNKTEWLKGWQEFGPWPTSEVLKPLKITIDELGIVARLRKDWPGSGTVIPLYIYHSKLISKIEGYTIHLKSKENLDKVQYTLYRLGSTIPIKENTVFSKFYGGVAFPIKLDLADQKSGYFNLVIDCEFESKIGGPKRKFTFYHNKFVE